MGRDLAAVRPDEALAIARPRPVPRESCDVWKRSKMRGSSSDAIPAPLSSTGSTRYPASPAAQRVRTVPPWRVPDRVGQEVVEDPANALRVDVGGREARLRRQLQRHPGSFRLRPGRGDGVLDGPGEGERAEVLVSRVRTRASSRSTDRCAPSRGYTPSSTSPRGCPAARRAARGARGRCPSGGRGGAPRGDRTPRPPGPPERYPRQTAAEPARTPGRPAGPPTAPRRTRSRTRPDRGTGPP